VIKYDERKRTYQVQTNLSVQTVQTLIWTIRSTSKEGAQRSGRGNLQKCDYPIQGWAASCKIIQSPHTPWMLIRWFKLEFARFARRGWFVPDMFPNWKATALPDCVINDSASNNGKRSTKKVCFIFGAW